MRNTPDPHGLSSNTLVHRAAAQQRLLARFPAVTWSVDTPRCLHGITGRAMTDRRHQEADFIGMPLAELYKGSPDASKAIAAHETALSGAPAEFRVTWNGRDYHGQLEPILNDRGETIGCVRAALDVTHANRETERLERAARLQRSWRMR